MKAQLADVFTPGLYMLETNNMPIMTTLQHWDHGFKSPFKSEIYFVNTTRFAEPQMGHQEPDHAARPGIRAGALRAFGTYTMRVADPARFMTEIVGTDGEFTMDEISFQIRNIIVQELFAHHRGLGHSGARHGGEHRRSGQAGGGRDRGVVAEYGLTIPELYIENISPAARGGRGARQAHLDGAGGRSGPFTQYSAAEAMTGPPASPAAARWARGWAPGWAWRWPAQMAQAGPWGAGARPAARRRRRRRPRRSSGSGTSPRTARRGGRFRAPRWAGWRPMAG
jgi:hypothetical protein